MKAILSKILVRRSESRATLANAVQYRRLVITELLITDQLAMY